MGGGDFPNVRISDDVRAQHRLVTEEFGIEELQLVLGWSMGAQQTYEWAVRYPEMVKRAAPIAGTAKNPTHSAMLVDALTEAIEMDPSYDEGYYDDASEVRRGLKHHARTWALMSVSSELWREESWREVGFSSLSDFNHGMWDDWFLPTDPNDLLCMAWKWETRGCQPDDRRRYGSGARPNRGSHLCHALREGHGRLHARRRRARRGEDR
jgi:homoserine O-acetyltransferase